MRGSALTFGEENMSKRRSRWLDIFKRRAKTTGELPSSRAQELLGQQFSNEDAKVDNSNPSEEFAINLAVDLDYLFSLETEEEVVKHVVAKDDFGSAVEMIPLSETSSSVWFDFCSAGPTHDYDCDEISIAQFVTNTCYIIKDEMIPNPEQFDYLHLESVDGLKLKRITWNSSLDAWYFQFD
jgi:hypothetical protein